MRHVADASMPADFLTKWLASAKTRDSIRYATNSKSLPPIPAPQAASANSVGGGCDLERDTEWLLAMGVP